MFFSFAVTASDGWKLSFYCMWNTWSSSFTDVGKRKTFRSPLEWFTKEQIVTSGQCLETDCLKTCAWFSVGEIFDAYICNIATKYDIVCIMSHFLGQNFGPNFIQQLSAFCFLQHENNKSVCPAMWNGLAQNILAAKHQASKTSSKFCVVDWSVMWNVDCLCTQQ